LFVLDSNGLKNTLKDKNSVNDQNRTRFIAFYLPQFHPIPENDMWWGKGFTEWTNTTKAKPLFPRHSQPKLPADLGFYDLRVPEVREAQADLARKYGIEGFCYWHYWFSGKRILERPFKEVLESGKPDFPFCLSWANESWSGVWHGAPEKILLQQKYPGRDDYKEHINILIDAFLDKRYIRVDDKPLFIIYKPLDIPDLQNVIEIFQETAINNGLQGLYICGYTNSKVLNPIDYNLDGIIYSGFNNIFSQDRLINRPLIFTKLKNKVLNILFGYPEKRFSYKSVCKIWSEYPSLDYEDYDIYPVVFPNWDNSPRSGNNGIIILGSTPELFKKHIILAKDIISSRENQKKIIFIKSWNEWAEGNYLEPDVVYGSKYLEIIKELEYS
jgi:hypothetical protein